jgi:prepilin-type N-terminal cleavage/methylation domain-containing protein
LNILFSSFKRNRSQRGFTLVEVLVGIAILGVISTAIAAATGQIININESSQNRFTAVKQLETAVDTIRVDIQVAQEISIEEDESYTPEESNPPEIKLNMKWTEWDDNSSHQVKYYLTSDNILQRVYITADETKTRNAAFDIQDIEAARLSSGAWSITISAESGSYKSAGETRTFTVLPRSGS